MIRTIIIDDERHCIDRLKNLLATYCQNTIELAGYFETVEEGLQGIKQLNPELIFLDIQIHDKTAFDLLNQLKEINFELIFTTAYEKYAIQAFKFSALDYLLKPIDPDDLRQAIQKVDKKRSKEEIAGKLEVLLHNLKEAQGLPPKITIPTMSGLMFIRVSDIIRCESNINYTTIFLNDKQKITVAKSLKEFEELLTGHHFFRVHHSHLINLAYIKSYQKGKGGSVLMEDHSEIEVSTRRKEAFLKRLSTG